MQMERKLKVQKSNLQIFDKEGNVVDEWISTNEPHNASGLEEGKTYTLHEDLAPNGYNVANDFEFEVTYDKVDQVVEMIDTIVNYFNYSLHVALVISLITDE